MYLFKKKAVPMLGIDISVTAVKLLEISSSKDRFQVESYAVEPLPANAMSEKTINDIDAVGETISKVVRKSKTSLRNVAVAVAGSAVITKVITLPAGLSEIEMEDQMQIEADQHIPFPLEEVAMDFEVLGEDPSAPEERVEVMLAAARNDVVDGCVAAAEIGGLKVKVVDIESFAIDNSLAFQMGAQAHDGIIAVADVGSTITSFSVMENLKTIYFREQPFGGMQLTQEIQGRYGLSFEEAGIAKKRGGLPDNYEPEVLQPFKESMAQEIGRAQQFFFSSSGVSHIDQLVLAGGCASIPGVLQMVQEKVGVPTVLANPFHNMTVSSKVSMDGIIKDAPALMVACGLALRGAAT